MRVTTLNATEAAVLEKIAKRSKMDDWFRVVENGATLCARELDINTMMDGCTPYDLSNLNETEVYTLVNILLKTNPLKKFSNGK